ncbi:Os08g0132951 [Oryza sativa Japonica Group]|uniref:Os08g0132951 protein n=1 Tax=Oryza sativa subsp. japonica TaxID=39947 RepID=A0A0P0XBQ1_ORYSJ|nr:Os08g0132951 [Oryza sativa Japonica Group]
MSQSTGSSSTRKTPRQRDHKRDGAGLAADGDGLLPVSWYSLSTDLEVEVEFPADELAAGSVHRWPEIEGGDGVPRAAVEVSWRL